MKSFLRGAVLFSLLSASVATADYKQLQASSDRCADDTNSDFVADVLEDDSDVYLRVFGTQNGAGDFRCAIEFPGLPAGAVVTSAILHLYDGGTVSGGDVIEIHGYSGNGTVELADMAVSNLVTSYTNSVSDVGRNLDVTTFVQSLLDEAKSTAGFMLRRDTEGEPCCNGSDINSNDASSEQPMLSLEYEIITQPVPAMHPIGLLLLVTGVLFIMVRTRRLISVRR